MGYRKKKKVIGKEKDVEECMVEREREREKKHKIEEGITG